MPKFSVDVKAFVKVEVEAPDAKTARQRADAWVEGMPEGVPYVGAVKSASVDVDGTSEVERLCEECGEEIGNNTDAYCIGCEPEEPEPPLDTPSLDTSFHDHEMNV